jgi:very-short-patch-repair endonuclease
LVVVEERPVPHADALVRLRVDLDRRINFAMQQNDVPVVKTLHVDNQTGARLHDLRLRVHPEPAFAGVWETRLEHVAARSTYNLPAVDLVLSPGYLGELTERVRGQLRFELLQGSEQGDERIAEHVEAVELLARDEWSGLASLPEILAAFVMPNHPAVERVLRDAGDLLGGWTGDPSLSGYQSRDPRRVYTMAGAIYSALQRLGITYVNPPASFEAEGQRIRLPDRILETRLATCLDLAVLAAGCLEQAGLHPLIVVVRGHAFVGVWLQDECFGEPATDEPLRLRKRVELDEIAVFDPICVTARPALDFSRAVQDARRRLDDPDDFLCAIDVHRARKGQVRPLPERVARAEATAASAAEGDAAAGAPQAPEVSGLQVHDTPVTAAEAEAAETPATRLDRWCRRLLDLSLRNRLINFRETKKTIPLLCPDASALQGALADGATFQVLPRPRDLAPGDPRYPEAYRRRTGSDAVAALLREQLRARRLHADLTPEELDRRLLEVYRAARLGIEEGGASALYLAVGCLAWYETPQSAERRLAPILLVPLELHRRSAREGFTLRLGDDEARVNITLLELLKQDHAVAVPGLDPLPEGESGIDVARILRTFRQAIRDIDRWDVVESACIGIFSFAKFLMWRDLAERAQDLVKNPVVDHLVNRPDQEFDPGAIFPDPGQLDEARSPLQTFCPLPADASQLAAVFAAADGRSFVLEGPPGTGKSQTITNLIAHCLAEGKSVLFVSEKMAALDVVHDRLQKAGLGRHCLELHSSKAHKSEVLARLDDALRRHETGMPDGWEREAQRLASLRAELNAYAGALHRRRSTGETVFEATSRLIGLRDAPAVELAWPSPDAVDAEQLAALRDLAERLATAAAAVGEVADHPWQAARRADWTPAWEREVRVALDRLAGSIETVERSAGEASARLGLGEGGWSFHALACLDELAGVLLDSPAPPAALLVRPDWDEIQSRITSWIEHGRRRDALRQDVLARFTEDILGLDLDALRAELQQANASWRLAGWWRRRAVRKALASVSRNGEAPPTLELAPAIEKARALREEERALAAAGDEARALLGRHWKDGEPDWKGVESVRDWAARFRSVATRAAGDDLERAADLRARWARVATDGQERLRPDGVVGRELRAYRSAWETFAAARNGADALLELDTERAWGRPDAAEALGEARRRLRTWSERIAELREWCAWRRARADAVAANLSPLVDGFERGLFQSGDFRPVFERSFLGWWHAAVVSAEPVLARFFSPEHQRKIAQFREADERYIELTRQLIASRLAEKVPASSAVDLPSSEVGILKREIGKRRNHMAVRKLLGAIPNLLPRLKPCLLMSPLSVAQYVDAGYPPFDLVVFDEASQIPVWDAIGAIARGRQAVIVGDPKQLPPTTFFQRADDAEDEAPEPDTVEDLESILDECIGARLPYRALDWHYRSRHESLIAFSNHHYYGNRLLTFPSPHREDMGVSLRPVPGGVYDRGKSATNRAEADAIVEEVLRRLRDPVLRGRSIGVVTFSQAQQTLVEDFLEKVRQADPDVDAFFSEEAAEPVFVKNLENVQGDERDVILFSICYGPDALGRVSMNFGPMNREGGERRLNVAITRARREVVVFSTLRADQIDLARTRARGARDLKSFLEYAERGPSAIAEATRYDPQAEFDSPFEQAVRDALAGKGWQVHQQVGCARYRIDLAVVDPGAPGRYLLGVECDGANYHRARTARDRDKLREAILRDLGWQLHRIWSADWWSNPEQEIRKLEAALDRAVKAGPRRGAGPEAATVVSPPVVSTPVAATPVAATPAGRIASAPGALAESSAAPRSTPAASSPAAGSTPAPSRPSAPEEPRLPVYLPYVVKRSLGTPDDFHQPAADAAIRRVIADVTRQEGPISLRLAARRVAAHWGIARMSEKVVERVRRVLPSADVLVQSSATGEFLWPSGKGPETYDAFRVPGSDADSDRDAADLPLEEVANAALFLLRRHISAPEEEIVREASRLFGFRRTGTVVEARMRAGIALLVDRGRARRDGAAVVLEER